MKELLKDYEFLKNYVDCKLTSVITAPYWPEESKMVSDEVLLNFSDGRQLDFHCEEGVIEAFLEPGETIEDVIFTVKEERNHTPFCNIGYTKMQSILVDEEVESVKLYFDNMSFADETLGYPEFAYPVGVFIETKNRRIGICRQILDDTSLNADYRKADPSDTSLMFALEEHWGSARGAETFIAKRYCYDFKEENLTLFGERRFCE